MVKKIACLRSVHFSDDIFTHDREWVLRFCEAYHNKFSKLPFTCNTTVLDVDDEMLGEMKKAGCSGIAIGVETGNEQLRMVRLNKARRDYFAQFQRLIDEYNEESRRQTALPPIKKFISI